MVATQGTGLHAPDPAAAQASAHGRRVAGVPDLRWLGLLIGLLLGAFSLGTTAHADVYTVTTAAGGENPADGACSLFEAINGVNGGASYHECVPVVAAGIDRIEFAIPGPGVKTIIETMLPHITTPVVIDGYTQPGASVNTRPDSNDAVLLIEIKGNYLSSPTSDPGLYIRGDGSVVRGLIVSNYASGILTGANNVVIEGNFVGTTPDGASAAPNRLGVEVNNGSGTIIGGVTPAARNVISGNLQHGVHLDTYLFSVSVLGNDIGVNATGQAALPNGGSGVKITTGIGHQIGGGEGTTPGGICSGACNVISGNAVYGVEIESIHINTPARNNQILGNRIGLRRGQDRALPNGQGGIMILNSSGNTIGGGTPETRNIISGNGNRGIEIRNSLATDNVVRGNFIGTGATGAGALGNTGDGILIWVEASRNAIGGTVGTTPGGPCTGDCNLISGNRTGIAIESPASAGNRVLGNVIGTNVSGTSAVPNQRGGIDSSGAATVIGGLTPQARNLVSGNIGTGIVLSTSGEIRGNYVGVNAAGTGALGNSVDGIAAMATNLVVGGTVAGSGNLIGGNGRDGVLVAASGVQVVGNLIGTDKNGIFVLPNYVGVRVSGPDAQIGGPAESARNVISGNRSTGVLILGSGARVRGNLIGMITPSKWAPNLGDGVLIDGAPSATIGGAEVGAGNVVSSNEGNGVRVRGSGSIGAQILGNMIGTNPDGTDGRGNQANGILIEGAPAVTIGGETAAARNVISDNGSHGIRIFGSEGSQVRGNLIGTNASGAPILGNAGAGISVLHAAANIIGGTTAGQGNTIAGNGSHGVMIEGDDSSRNAILGNAIFRNAGLGIDLNDDGITPNDPSDADAGPNKRQNFPLVTGATFTGTPSTPLSGMLASAPSTTYRIELFSNDAADPTGPVEGQRFLGSTMATTDAAGAATFSLTVPVALTAGQVVTATATDPQNNTSEFGQQQSIVTAACTPRPKIAVSTANQGDGRLRVTLSLTEQTWTPNNRLTGIEFRAGSNALIDVAGQTGRKGAFTVPLTDRPTTTTFFVRRETPGQAVQLPLAVTDDCGSWTTFVGGGAGAF
jgi:hypothetical protein